MIKIFLIITAAALLAAAVLGVQSRNDFIQARNDRAENNKKIDAVIKTIEEEETPAMLEMYASLLGEENRLAQAEADLGVSKDNITTLNGEISELQAKMAPIERDLNEAKSAIDDIAAKFPGVTPENIGQRIKEIELQLEETKQELAAKQAEIEIVEGKVAANRATIGRYQGRQTERLASIQRNSIEGTVTAVNNDWGFAVINLGSSQGISGDSTLIVKRAGSRIGNLSVVSAQTRSTVVNIDQDSLAGSIQPGDRVIFEKTGK